MPDILAAMPTLLSRFGNYTSHYIPFDARLPSICFFTLIFVISWSTLRRKERFPVVNPPSWLESRWQKKLDFVQNGLKILSMSRDRYFGKPFKIISNLGDVIVLPPKFANDIRNDTSLSLRKAIIEDFHTYLPGFRPFELVDHPAQILQTVVRKQLTKYLNAVTEPMASETAFATNLVFGNSSDWQGIHLHPAMLDVIARISSRVFLGEELCRNDAWLRVSKEYTVKSFTAAAKLRLVPRFLRTFVNLVDPSCRQVGDTLTEGRQILKPYIEERRKLNVEARVNGNLAPSFNDALEWCEIESNGQPYDHTNFQLLLSFVAIHTTTDLVSKTLLFLACEPELIEPLRQEMVETLRIERWKKSALYNMKLLDSTIKEAMRIKPTEMLQLRRLALKDVSLPDGNFIHKGERVCVDSFSMLDPKVYPNPEKFDIYRFRRMREEPGNERKAQLVSTSPDYLGFGHGVYACPGRFFASNEIKVALCYLLIRYDWKLADENNPHMVITSTGLSVNPKLTIMFRRRKEEIDLEALRETPLDGV